MTASVLHELKVELGEEHSYYIRIGTGLLSDSRQIGSCLAGQQVMVVSNQSIALLYMDSVKRALVEANPQVQIDECLVPDGEAHKNMQSWALILDALMAKGYRRSATILALGGGVVGDMAGFAAACYQRGVAFIQLPTSLLAQVDSSVGGKTAINHPGGKNMIGAFYQPKLVLADLDVLETLPPREYRAGLAELLKHAIIRDANLFDWLEANVGALCARSLPVLAEAIYRSVLIKVAIVAADERESGQRALLNFGHTFGHALELELGYGVCVHGEAVAMGMVLASALSVQEGRLDKDAAKRIEAVLKKLGLPVALPVNAPAVSALRQAMMMDKKATDAGLSLILLDGIGQALHTTDFQEKNLQATWAQAIT